MPGTGRNQIAYDDERMTSQTFWADGSTIVFTPSGINGLAAAMLGKAVTYSATADDTVKLCADGDAVVGKLLKCEPDGACTVQIAGYTSLPAGNAASNTRGKLQVGALGPASAAGYIRDANTATAAELARTGPHAVAVADTANIWVDFGG
jgi:hypothetical protein